MTTEVSVETNTLNTNTTGMSLHMTAPNIHDFPRALMGVKGTANKHMSRSLTLRQAMNLLVIVCIDF